MIADVLCEARLELERYLREFPDTYADMREEVEALCALMAGMQAQLDNPFFGLDGGPVPAALPA